MATTIQLLNEDREVTLSGTLTNTSHAQVPTSKAVSDYVAQHLDNASAALDALGTAANGDMLIRSGGVWVLLAKGSDGDIMTMVSGLPAWVTPTP